MATESIKFPILFRYHQYVIPAGPDMLKPWALKHLTDNQFMLPKTRKNGAKLHWLIDGHGRLREVNVIGASNEWLRPLSWLWSFTQTIYEIKPGRTATVGELLRLNEGTSFDGEKSRAEDFGDFLSKYAPNTPLTRTMFLDFMNESLDVDLPSYP